MSHENLRLTRNILLRSFVVGLGITLLLAVVTITSWDTCMSMAATWFHTDQATLTPLMIKFFMNARFFLLFILLTPALALHWTIKKETHKKK